MPALPASATRDRIEAACRSKDLWTPRVAVPAENRVSALDRPGFQLDDAACAPQRAERDTAEQRGAERLHGQRQLGCVFTALGAPSGQFPPSLVPRTELVGDVEDDRTVVGIGPA